MSYEEAIEYFELNVLGAYMGEKTLFGLKIVFQNKKGSFKTPLFRLKMAQHLPLQEHPQFFSNMV